MFKKWNKRWVKITYASKYKIIDYFCNIFSTVPQMCFHKNINWTANPWATITYDIIISNSIRNFDYLDVLKNRMFSLFKTFIIPVDKLIAYNICENNNFIVYAADDFSTFNDTHFKYSILLNMQIDLDFSSWFETWQGRETIKNQVYTRITGGDTN